eukprot:TRINITY_DN3234_c0_g5_i1.p1 TRINITY_DN3234_c0_g5~~TRINITY_DN3234_c0_g5_i1.p1  ORF type:complete len:284 (-),score=50.48 TRINITY_DN3234_c0_g5_i1:226-1077(-)
MALEPYDEEADQFLLCVFKKNTECDDWAAPIKYITKMEGSMKKYGATIQLRSDRPENWEILDGQDNYVEPNHLNPAIFDFDSILLAGFKTTQDVYTWWTSEEVFELMKWREPLDKLGVFVIEGMTKAVDPFSKQTGVFGDKHMYFELMKQQSFQPMQYYCDNYKRLIYQGMKEMGVVSTICFAEGVGGVLMSDFPIEAACASAWKTKADIHGWFESNIYQKNLYGTRMEYSKSVTMIVPLMEDRIDNYEKVRKSVAGSSMAKGKSKLKGLQLPPTSPTPPTSP